MAINKVTYAGDTLIDLTSDSVSPDTLAEGETAHDASGARITGKMKSVGIDKTLTLSDYASDAKVVGDLVIPEFTEEDAIEIMGTDPPSEPPVYAERNWVDENFVGKQNLCKLLWDNPNKDAPMSAQTITADFSKHSLFVVIFGSDNSASKNHDSVFAVKGNKTTMLTTVDINTKTDGNYVTRAITINDSNMVIGKGAYAGANHTLVENYSVAIPLRVYGLV